jgi:uridine kinase
MLQVLDFILNSKAKCIAIDGVDAAGKTSFAQKLQESLKKKNKDAIVIHIDNFHQPKSYRYRLGENSAEGFFYDSYQYEYFIENCLMPFKNGIEKIVVRCFDLEKDCASIEYMSLNPETILIVEGLFLHRDELLKFWDYSIYLDVNTETSLHRNLNRSLGSNPNLDIEKYKLRFHIRYKAGQELYFEKFKPQQKASIVINNNSNLAIQNLELKINN